MRTGKILLLAAGCTVVLLGIAVGVASTSWFQTWAFRKALAGQAGMDATVERVSVGLHRVEIENLRIRKDGIYLELPSLEAELSVYAAAKSDLRIQRVVARGWKIDLTRQQALAGKDRQVGSGGTRVAGASAVVPGKKQAQAAGGVPLGAVFPGLFPQLKIPVALCVEEADLAGEIVFGVKGAKEAGRVAVSTRGGMLGVGREALFDVTLVAAVKDESPISQLGAKGRLRVSMDSPMSVDRVGVEMTAVAKGSQVPKGAELSLKFNAAKKDGAEVYDIEVGTGGKQMVEAHTEYQTTGGKLTGRWKLDLKDEALVPFVMGIELPQFIVQGEGRLSAELDGTEVLLSGLLDAKLDRLKVLRPEMAAFGALRVQTDFDLAYRKTDVRVTKLLLNLEGTNPVLRLQALQGFEYGFETSELRIADPSKDLVRCEVLGLPLSWVRPWTGDFLVEGSDMRAVFTLAARAGGLIVRGDVPARVEKLMVARGQQTLVKGLDVSVLISGDYSPQRWQAVIQDFTARADRMPVFWLKGRVGRLAGAGQAIKAEGKWLVQLPELLEQPVAAKVLDVRKGRMSCDFSASIGAKQEIQADIKLTELQAGAAGDKVLPNVTVQLRADRAVDGSMAIQMPVQITGRREFRVSDVQLNGKIMPKKTALDVDLAVLSQNLVVEDLQSFSAVVPSSEGSKTLASQAPRTPAPDQAPFWSGISGKITLALKSVKVMRDIEVKDVSGKILVEGGVFKMDGVKAALPEGATVRVTTQMKFDGKAAEPYSLGGDVMLEDFASTSWAPKSSSSGTPAIDAMFDVEAKVEGEGRTVGELIEQTRGSFVMTSKSGTCRLLKADVSESVKSTQKGASIVGNIGAMLGSDRLTNYAEQAQTVAQIAKVLEEITFDQLSMTVVRDAELNIRLQEFTLISPQLRLGGSGEIRHIRGATFEERPMDLRLQMGVRGDLAGMMTKVGLLDGRQDNLGYQGFSSPVRVGGTLLQPDNGDLQAILKKAATGSLLNRLLKR